MQIFDRMTIGDARLTESDGFLVADVRAARTGIQIYTGSEVGAPERAQVRVYRPEAEVFSPVSMGTYAHKPVTLDHPPVAVDATNWKKFAVGQIGGEIARDGQFIRIPLALMDAEAIKAVQSGKRELSVGYACDLQFGDGVTPDGQPYDAIQKDIRVDHVAVVERGRAGPDCRITDRPATTPEERTDMTTQKVTIDSITVELSDTAAQVVSKLLADHAALKTALTTAQTALTTAQGEHAGAIATKDGEIAGLRKQIPDAAALDALVAERVGLVDGARKVLGATWDATGKTGADIKRAVAAKAFGDDAVKDKPDAFVDGLFAAAMKGAGVDPVAKALGGLPRTPTTDASKAHDEMKTRLADAWKTPNGRAA